MVLQCTDEEARLTWERTAELTGDFAYRIGRRLLKAGEKNSLAVVKPWERPDWWKSYLCNEEGEVPEDWTMRATLERRGGISLLGFRAALIEIIGSRTAKVMQEIDQLFICFDASCSLNGAGLIPLPVVAEQLRKFTEDARVAVPGSKQNVAAQIALWHAEEKRRRALALAEAELTALEALAAARAEAEAEFWRSPTGLRILGHRRRMADTSIDGSRHGFSSIGEVRRFFGSPTLNGLGGWKTSLRQASSSSLREEAPDTIGGHASPAPSTPPPVADQRARSRREGASARVMGQRPPGAPLEASPASPDAQTCYLTLAPRRRDNSDTSPPRCALPTLHELDA